MTTVVVERPTTIVRSDRTVRAISVVRSVTSVSVGIQGMQGPPGADGLGANPPTVETPSGTINGQNTVFTLSGTPRDVADLRLLLNGIELLRSVSGDYTVSGMTIMFNAGLAPVSGDRLTASYIGE